VKDGDLEVAAPMEATSADRPPVPLVPPVNGAVANDERTRPQPASARRATVARLMATHGDAVFGFCMRVVRARSLAEDVVQQVFLEAYRDLDGFEGRSSERAWLLGIAIHRCLDLLKTQQRRLKLIESNEQAVLDFKDPGASPIERLDRARLTTALDECLKRLSPDVRATVLLRFQTGSTYEELAIPLAASADALQIRVSRALPILRRCLESKGWADD
jgi:RNA polymerase sigma-70 factor (ECF subfamily)